MKAFTFDLQRFDTIDEPDGFIVNVEGFDDEVVEISTSDDGRDLISITTPKNTGGLLLSAMILISLLPTAKIFTSSPQLTPTNSFRPQILTRLRLKLTRTNIFQAAGLTSDFPLTARLRALFL